MAIVLGIGVFEFCTDAIDASFGGHSFSFPLRLNAIDLRFGGDSFSLPLRLDTANIGFLRRFVSLPLGGDAIDLGYLSVNFPGFCPCLHLGELCLGNPDVFLGFVELGLQALGGIKDGNDLSGFDKIPFFDEEFGNPIVPQHDRGGEIDGFPHRFESPQCRDFTIDGGHFGDFLSLPDTAKFRDAVENCCPGDDGGSNDEDGNPARGGFG